MGKRRISITTFIKRKYIYGPKKDPVWVFLEQQMREMEEKGIRPYNNQVGDWLKFLRDLRYFFYCEAKRKLKQLWVDVGPAWYFEYSPAQKKVLEQMPSLIRQDVIDNYPTRTRSALRSIGITLKFSKNTLLHVMKLCNYDEALFFWELFNAHYHQPPCVPMPKYELNAKLIISAIVFLDLDECIQELEKLTRCTRPPSPQKRREIKKYWEPKIKFGAYLQKLYVPVVTREKPKEKRPCPLPMKIKIQSEEFYQARALNDAVISIQERKKRQVHVLPSKRTCNYKFWQAPICMIASTNPIEAAKENAFAVKLRMYRSNAHARHLKLLPQYPNKVVQIGNVAFTGGSPVFIINSTNYVPTGYIIFNGGKVPFGNEYVTLILGHFQYPRPGRSECQVKCTCLEKWDECVMKHLKDKTCKCGHRYDFYNDGKPREKYIYPPNRYGPLWFDHAKIYQFFYPPKKTATSGGLTNWEDFIRDRVEYEFMKDCIVKSAFFAELSKSPLLIPHLPQAYHLNMLCEWARRRVHGKIGPKHHKHLLLTSERRWAALGHIDFRARAYHIPFTEAELKRINFTHRPFIGKLAHKMFMDFKTRSGLKQVQMTQLWLGTMKHDVYPSKTFTDVFFSYLPARTTDIQVLSPYKRSAFLAFGHTCPLKPEDAPAPNS